MIEVRNLTKHYGNVEAVQDVSFSVGKDQVLGFLGPNGAGKTTIMKILTGFHFPSSGTALVEGFRIEDNPVEVKKRIGYLPENVPLYGDLTVDEYLTFIAEARLIPASERKQAINTSLESCGLTAYRSRKIDTLSKGYRQRTGLAQAILHDPPILILDEPTNGLDPNQIIEIRSLIKELGRRKTVILSTHIMQEVEAICSQVLIIHEGKIAAQGTPDEIAGTMKGGDTWELIIKGADAGSIHDKLTRLGEITSVSAAQQEDGTTSLTFFVPGGNFSGRDIPAGELIFDWAVAEGVKILGMSRKKLSVEDIFVSLTSDSAAERMASADSNVKGEEQ
ncbi:MAG: ATP-binding cassette domain-containing protein [Treponema sp.]|nr:ATP-binding cassette domain-containing protein [Treponema sp.]